MKYVKRPTRDTRIYEHEGLRFEVFVEPLSDGSHLVSPICFDAIKPDQRVELLSWVIKDVKGKVWLDKWLPWMTEDLRLLVVGQEFFSES